MKLFFICSSIMGILLAFAIVIDLVMGYQLHNAIQNVFTPFKVMDFIELFLLLSFIFIFFMDSILTFVRKHKR